MDPEPVKVGDVVWVCAVSIESEQYQDPTGLVPPAPPRRIKIVEIDERGSTSVKGYGYYDNDELDDDSNNTYVVYLDNVYRTAREAYERHVVDIGNYLEELAQEAGTWTDEYNKRRQQLHNDTLET